MKTKISNNGVLPQTEVNFTELAAQLEATNQAAQQTLSSAPSTAQAETKLKQARTAGYYESGMALNITHGIQVVDYLITYGAAYNPS
ncbi:MAG TPA: hypothetical protein DHV22_11080, partial [Xanthomarina gelatinilytica]|nr:hypothetical protein [Xanthomarina gelatinilytica]